MAFVLEENVTKITVLGKDSGKSEVLTLSGLFQTKLESIRILHETTSVSLKRLS